MFRVPIAAIFSFAALSTASIVQAGDVAIRAPICVPSDFHQSDFPLVSKGDESDRDWRKRFLAWFEANHQPADCTGEISLSDIESSYQKEKKTFTDNPVIVQYNEAQRLWSQSQKRAKAQWEEAHALHRKNHGLSSLLEDLAGASLFDQGAQTTPPTYAWSLFSDFPGCGSYSWIPASSTQGGPAELKKLRDRAKSGRPFGGGSVIVEGDDSSKDEQHLALCRVRVISGAIGPPRACTTVAVITAHVAWLRIHGPDLGCPNAASFRPTGGIDIRYKVITTKPLADFVHPLIHLLRPYFHLSTTIGNKFQDNGILSGISLDSTAALRGSTILQGGWREAIDFDLELSSGTDSRISAHGFEVSGVAHALICRQASGNLTDYRGPNDSQRSAYATTFDSKIAETLMQVCGPRSTLLDAATIDCK